MAPEPPPWTWSIDCFVSLSFFAIPSAVASFDCVTSPSSPFEPTRIEEFSFDGLICTAVASANAFWSESAFCPAIWVYEEPLSE